MIVLLNLREYLGTVHVLPLADHSGLLFRLAALCPALLEASLHFDLEAAILFALPHEFIIVFRVELNRQRVVVAGQRAAFPRLGFYPDRAARLEIAVDFDFAPRLGFESQGEFGELRGLCRVLRHTQASRRWRGGRRDDSARTRRKFLISTQSVA